jgi:CRP-like cAMP-binding protein
MLSTGLSKPKILIVEDNSLVADAICEVVRDSGCDVAGAVGHVQQGVQFLADRMVDGAVVDINLHGSLSFPICDELQRRNVPFFFLTGYPSYAKDVPSQFRYAKFLTKPLDAGQFKSALEEMREVNGATDRTVRRWGNALLDTLDTHDLQLLEPKLERVALREDQSLQTAAGPVTHVHFLTSGLVSLVARCPQGRRMELSLVGAEGATGLAGLLDRNAAAVADAVVQIPGGAWRISLADLLAAARAERSLQDHLLAYVHSLMAQVAETALATGHAKIEQRLARWLLMAADRCGRPKLPVTHEQLARSLAVRRSGITVALHMLESRQLVRSQRKLVEIVDRQRLMHEVDGLLGWSRPAKNGTPVGVREQGNQVAGRAEPGTPRLMSG